MSPVGLGSLVGAVGARLDPGRRQRRHWTGPRRVHIEVRAVHRPECTELARQIEKALEQVDAVEWAEVNPLTGRVVVSFDPRTPDVAECVRVIEDVEDAHGVHDEPFPDDRPEHPSDSEPLRRNGVSLAIDVAALGTSVFGQVLRVTPIPAEIANLVGIAEYEPRVRRFLEHHLGYVVTDLGVGIASALTQALSQGPAGLAVSIVHRAGVVSEVRARQRTWERLEPELCGRRGDIPMAAVGHVARPVPLPDGPIERYADRASVASIGAFALGYGLTRSPRRAATRLAASWSPSPSSEP